MTTSVLRTSDAWWVQTPSGAAKIATTAATTGELLADRAAAKMLPARSRVHLFDTGHFWPFEAPRETVDVIREFLDSNV